MWTFFTYSQTICTELFNSMFNMETCPNKNKAGNIEMDVSDLDVYPQAKRIKPNYESDEVTMVKEESETMGTVSSVNKLENVTDNPSCLPVSDSSPPTLPQQTTLTQIVPPWVGHSGHQCNNQSAGMNDTITCPNTNVASDFSAQEEQQDNIAVRVKFNDFENESTDCLLNRHPAEHNCSNTLSSEQESIANTQQGESTNILHKNENSKIDEKKKTENYAPEMIDESYAVKSTSSSSPCLQETDLVNRPDSEKLISSKQCEVSSGSQANSVDIYDINEHDENSLSLTLLHKLPKMSQNKKDIPKPEERLTEKAGCDFQSQQCLKTRVAYIHSETYIRVCDEMMRVAGRASLVHSLIDAYGLLKYMDMVPPRETTPEELLQFHTANYIQFLEKISQQEDDEKYDEEAEQYGLTYDCPVHIGVYDYAVLVAGATIRAAELLVSGSCDVAMNWGGGWHHAKRDTASGFCYINDIALGILKLRENFERVLYVDLDLHHGDGVEDAFCTTSKVLTLSFHKYQPGFFPGTGSLSDVGVSKGRHYTVNVPLLDGIKDAEFYALFNRVISKVRERFKPEAVVCQCGADGVAGDPMESFNLTPLGLGRCVHTLQSWKIPLLLLGGGGYNFVNTAKCWAFITSVIVGKKLSDDIPDHKFFMKYGPDYELNVSVGNRKDNNSREYLMKVYRHVMENLSHIT